MERYWVWLSRVKYVGPVLQKNLIAQFVSPKAVYEADEKVLAAVPKMTKIALESILKSRCLKDAESIVNIADKNEVHILPFDHCNYPQFAKVCRESPIVLYYRGKLHDNLTETTIGVVGARRCSSYGRKIAEQIGEGLAHLKVPVISGFAKGIDSYAQASCTRNGGYTIAFLGTGPDICYPPEQRPLYDKILENGGCFISAFPPGTKAFPKYFLMRNALISAWSTELIIVEASERSGALTTVEFAIKNNKTVYAVPNQIDLPEGFGTNALLSKGHPPFLGIPSLQSIKNKSIEVNHNSLINVTKDDFNILDLIPDTPITIQQLFSLVSLNSQEPMDQLNDLELERKIIIRGNLIYKQS